MDTVNHISAMSGAMIVSISDFASFSVNVTDLDVALMRAEILMLEDGNSDLAEVTLRLLDIFTAWRESVVSLYPDVETVMEMNKLKQQRGAAQ